MLSNTAQHLGTKSLVLLLTTIICIFSLLSIKIYIDINSLLKQSKILTTDVNKALEQLSPIIKNLEKVAKTLQLSGNLTSKAYAKQKKLGRVINKIPAQDNILTWHKDISLLHQQTQSYLKQLRALVDDNMRTADESGGNFRALEESISNFQLVTKLSADTADIVDETIATLIIMIAIFIIASFGIIKLNIKNSQSSVLMAKAALEQQLHKADRELSKLLLSLATIDNHMIATEKITHFFHQKFNRKPTAAFAFKKKYIATSSSNRNSIFTGRDYR